MHSITLELRPRLRTCNAFIRLSEHTDAKNVEIKLSEESIRLLFEDNALTFLLSAVKITPNSLSALNKTNDWITFRVQTKSDSTFGSFRTEVITDTVPKINAFTDARHDYRSVASVDCVLSCTCCKNAITEVTSFQRILPLPDTDYDQSEWFCCAHVRDNTLPILAPRKNDLFYGPFFTVLNANLFSSNVKITDNAIFCNRCLRHLGKVHAEDSYKLWNSCIDYNSSSGSLIKPAPDPRFDFLVAIETSLTGVFGEEVILRSFVKNQVHRLTVKPMDWNLNMMTEPTVSGQSNVIRLRKFCVIKVLYKYETSNDTFDTDSISTRYCEVSLPVMEAGLKHLLTSTKRFPRIHRVAADYYVGHIDFDEIANQEILSKSKLRSC